MPNQKLEQDIEMVPQCDFGPWLKYLSGGRNSSINSGFQWPKFGIKIPFIMPLSGIMVNKPKDGMSWPLMVAALLFFSLVSFGLGVKKWCQYQQEM